MSQMPGKRLSASLIKAYWVQRLLQQGRGSSFLLFGNERMRWAAEGGGWGAAPGTDGRFCWCVSTVRDSPPANETSEDTEEPMAVPEDLSASSAHQQNNRGEKGTGKCTSTSQKCQTMLERNPWNLCQSGSNNGASIPRAPQKKNKSLKMSLLKAWLVCKWQKCTPTSSRTHPVGGTW